MEGCDADGGDGDRRDHAIGFPSFKIGFKALPIGPVKHQTALSARPLPRQCGRRSGRALMLRTRCPKLQRSSSDAALMAPKPQSSPTTVTFELEQHLVLPFSDRRHLALASRASRSLNFWILPDPVSGNASTTNQCFGVLCGASEGAHVVDQFFLFDHCAGRRAG